MHSIISICKDRFVFTKLLAFTLATVAIGIFMPLTASAAITNITLTSPLGGQDWRGAHDIAWTYTDNDGFGGTVSILYSTDGGTNFNNLVTGVPVNSLSYPWDTVSVIDGSAYKIKVVDPATTLSSQSTNSFIVDNTAPALSQMTAVPSFTNNNTPSYTFNTNEAGTITYGGGCLSATTAVAAGDNTIVFNTLADGSYSTCTITVTDDADAGGNASSPLAVNSFVVDTIAPIVDAGSDKNVNASVLQSATTTDAVPSSGVATYAWTKVSGTGAITFGSDTVEDTTISADTDGTYVLRLTATDNAGNSSSDDIQFIWDTTSPSLFITGAVTTTGGTIVSNWWNSTNTGVNIVVPVASDTSFAGGTIQIQAEADGTFENLGSAYTMLGTDITTGSKTLSFTGAELEALAGFSEGDVVTFNAVITDIAGNATIGTVSASMLSVDQTAPTVDAGSDKEVNALYAQNATVSDSLSGVATYVWTSHANVVFSSASTEDTDVSATTDGTYTLTLTAIDIAGNSNSATSTFVWDTTAPALSVVTPIPSPTNDTTPSYTFGIDKAAWLAGNAGTFSTVGACGTLSGTAENGNNTITFNTLSNAIYTDCDVVVTDKAGNISTALQINDFTVDTNAATTNSLSITTEDTDTNGKIDTVTIVFDNSVNDATFLVSDVTVGGIVPTAINTGTTANDNTILLSMGTEVEGTNAKTVAFTEEGAQDLAGNTIASFSFSSTDIAKPVLISARTMDTTHITATFSEDINGTTVNSSGNEFIVAGYAVSAAGKTSTGVVTLTVALMPTDAAPTVTYTQNGTGLNDLATLANTAVTPVTVTAVDGVAPVLTAVSISSNNAKNSSLWAKHGDTVTVAFTSSEQLHTNTAVTISGSPADAVVNIGNNWTATRVMQAGDTEDVIAFAVNFEDSAAPTHNTGTQQTVTMNSSSITYDETAPTVNSGTDKETKASFTQSSASASDSGSGLDFVTWTKVTIPGIVTFDTSSAVQTEITANQNGVYELKLYAEDEAGNSADDTMTLIWDTIAPILEFVTPAHLSTGNPITDGILAARFRQFNGNGSDHITLLNADHVYLEKQSDGADVQGVVSVQGGDGISRILEVPYTSLENGTTYCLSILAGALRDAAGNEITQDTEMRCFTTIEDTAAPYIASLTASAVGATTATVTVVTNEVAVCSISDEDEAFSAMTATATTDGLTHTATLTGLTEETTYNHYVRCEDTKHNTMTTSGHVSFTTTMLDTTSPSAPIITTQSATVNADSYVISGTAAADTPTDGMREITVYSGGAIAGTYMLGASQTSWSVTVLLTQNATSTFTAKSKDISGNESGVSNAVDIGDNDALEIDITAPAAPAITATAATTDADTYTVTGTITSDPDAQIVRLYNSSALVGSVSVPAGATMWSILASLTQNTTNVFTTTASDEAGNTSAVSGSVTITEQAIDTAAPAITANSVLAITTTSATVNVATSDNATCRTGLSDVAYASLPNVVEGSGTTAHTFTFTGLASNVEYNAYVRCADTAGNASESAHQAFTTLVDNSTATLAVTGMNAVKTYAATDDTYANGWSWTFLVTVPTTETGFAMKFADFASGANTIAAASNIRYYSAQSSTNNSSVNAVTITGANTYPANITLDSDLDANTAGRQIAVTVEMKVPVGSVGGSYSASYGVKSE